MPQITCEAEILDKDLDRWMDEQKDSRHKERQSGTYVVQIFLCHVGKVLH